MSPGAVLARLDRAVRCAGGFRLAFVRCDDAEYRDAMIAALRLRLRGKRVLETRVDSGAESLLAALPAAWRGGGPPAAVCVVGLEDALDGALGARLDSERSTLAEAVRAPVLIWLSGAGLARLAEVAPALWRDRAGLYEFDRLSLDEARALLTPVEMNGAGPGEASSAGANGVTPREEPRGAAATEGEAAEAPSESQDLEADLEPLPPLYEMPLPERQAAVDGRMRRLQQLVLGGPPFTAERMQRQAAVLFQLGALHQSLGETSRAAACFEESAALFGQAEDRPARGRALLQLGVTRHHQGRLTDAEPLYDLARGIADRAGDAATVATALHQSGMLRQAQGQLADAEDLLRAALAARRGIGDARGEAATLHQLGSLSQRRRDFAEALALYDASLAIKRELEDRPGIAVTLHQLGTVEHQQGRFDRALELYEESLQIKKAVGDRPGVAATLGQIGRLHQQQGRLKEALQHYVTGWVMFRSLESPYAEVARQLIQGVRAEAGVEQFEIWLKADLRAVAGQIREAVTETSPA